MSASIIDESKTSNEELSKTSSTITKLINCNEDSSLFSNSSSNSSSNNKQTTSSSTPASLSIEQQCRLLEEENQNLKDAQTRLQQQFIDAQRKERILMRRLANKEQEFQDYISQIAEFKSAQAPGPAALRSALLDPAVNLLFEKLKNELQSTKAKLEETQNELSAWKFTPDSNTGKRLMAKCRQLYQENEELGKMMSNGRIAQLEGELVMQKNCSEEFKKCQLELDFYLQEMDIDVEGMQSTIYFLQQELKTAREHIAFLDNENKQLKNSLTGTDENGKHQQQQNLKINGKTATTTTISHTATVTNENDSISDEIDERTKKSNINNSNNNNNNNGSNTNIINNSNSNFNKINNMDDDDDDDDNEIESRTNCSSTNNSSGNNNYNININSSEELLKNGVDSKMLKIEETTTSSIITTTTMTGITTKINSIDPNTSNSISVGGVSCGSSTSSSSGGVMINNTITNCSSIKNARQPPKKRNYEDSCETNENNSANCLRNNTCNNINSNNNNNNNNNNSNNNSGNNSQIIVSKKPRRSSSVLSIDLNEEDSKIINETIVIQVDETEEGEINENENNKKTQKTTIPVIPKRKSTRNLANVNEHK